MMPNLRKLKAQVENANAKGVENLSKKGVALSENATTLDIMNAISEINIGSGLGYKSITYNKADDTVTLIDKYGGEHAMSCDYRGGKLIGIAYDGKNVDLTYIADKLDYVGKANVNLIDAPVYGLEPLDYTVEFRLHNSPYKISTVKSGLSVGKPSVDPPDMGEYRFNGWKIDDEYMEFPYTPHRDVAADAYFQKVREEMELYDALSFLAEDKNGDVRWKANDGWSIAGYIPTDGHGEIMLIAKTQEACQINYEYAVHSGSIKYNNVTYYYCYANVSFGAVKLCNNVEIEPMSNVSSGNHQLAAKKILDKYFYVT